MEQRLLEIINDIRDKRGEPPVGQLTNSQSLRRDLGLDSLDLAELTVRIEDLFGVDIFEEGLVDRVEEVMDKIARENASS